MGCEKTEENRSPVGLAGRSGLGAENSNAFRTKQHITMVKGKEEGGGEAWAHVAESLLFSYYLP